MALPRSKNPVEQDVTIPQTEKPVVPKVSGNMWLFVGGAIFLLVIVVLLLVWVVSSRSQEMVVQPQGNGPAVSTPTPTPTPEPGLSILLMGKGGAGHEGGGLTDTMMIARILEEQQRIVLISIPRDLWVSIEHEKAVKGKGKINSAYPFGGGELAKAVASQVTGIPIDKFITIDFSGFEKAIDAIGGIDINVERAFTDYEYPIAGRETMDCATPVTGSLEVSEADLIASGALTPDVLPELPKQYPCRYEMLHFDAGMQHLNGKTALKYVRSRHSSEDGNDFSRSRRQKLVIEATATKLLSGGMITKVPTFFSTLRSHVDTDFSTADIAGLLPQATTIRSYPVTSITLSTDNYVGQGYTADRQFALTPLAGEGKYDAIHNWIASTIDPNIPLLFPTIQIDPNWKNSSASASVQNILIEAGYPVKLGPLVTKNATTSATLLIHNQNLKPEVIQAIQKLTGIQDQFVTIVKPTGVRDLRLLLP